MNAESRGPRPVTTLPPQLCRQLAPATLLALSCGAWLALPTDASAQDNALRSARDAFGERVGVEQTGLYNESQARGFDLGTLGAHRIDGAYFARQMGLSDMVLAGVGVRVGVSAARLDYPSPSGVAIYRLRDPSTEPRYTVSAGLRERKTLFGEARATFDALGGDVLVGGHAREFRFPGGTGGPIYEAGAVGKWRIFDQGQLTVFGSAIERDQNGEYGIRPTGGALPHLPPNLPTYRPDWATSGGLNYAFGALMTAPLKDWTVTASAFGAVADSDRTDFTLFETDATGRTSALTISTPERSQRSASAELRVARVFDWGAIKTRLGLGIRGRQTRVESPTSQMFSHGAVDLASPIYRPGPTAPFDAGGTRDEIDQVSGSLNGGITFGDRVELRGGAHRVRYVKRRAAATGDNEATDDSWFFNTSALVRVTSRSTLFASWGTGLEETGAAPAAATNRNEILPSVEAEQFEFGLQQGLGQRVNLILAAFDISKPTTGFRIDGSFGLVGRVRHRGFEASLVGEIVPGASLVLGAVKLDPKVTGPLVDAGLVGPKAPSIAPLVAVFGIDHRPQWAPGWSFDVQGTHTGKRPGDTLNSFFLPATTVFGAGLRYQFKAGDADAVFRFAVSNIFDRQLWGGGASGVVFPNNGRTFRTSLTLRYR